MAREVKCIVLMAKFPELCSFLGGNTCDTTASIHDPIKWYYSAHCSATSVMVLNEGKSLAGFLKGPEAALNNEGSRIAFLYTHLMSQDIDDGDNEGLFPKGWYSCVSILPNSSIFLH